MSQYCPTLLRYFSTAQPSPQPPAGALSAEKTSPVCADHVRLDLSFSTDSASSARTVKTVSYSARGCVGVIGLAHLASERLQGLDAQDLTAVDAPALISEMEFVDPEHTHAFDLVAEVIADIAEQAAGTSAAAATDTDPAGDHA